MRILQIGPIPPDVGGRTSGGVATHLWDLANYLAKQGHQVGVLGDNYLSTGSPKRMRNGIRLFGKLKTAKLLNAATLLSPIFWLKVVRTKIHFRSLMPWRGVLSGLLNYLQVINEFKPDFIHIHHLENRFPFGYFSVNGEIPIVTTCHSTHFFEFSPSSIAEKRKQFTLRNLHRARDLIFVSQFLEERFRTFFPGLLERKNPYIIHNPVNESLYLQVSKDTARETLGLKHDHPVLLFVGNLIPRKGVNLLIEAARLLRDQGMVFQLVVVGSGPQRDDMDEVVRRNQLNDQVRFEGQIPQDKLHLYYNASDLFVFPSEMESFGLVFVEAMLCGCPVIGRPEVLLEILPGEHCGLHLGSDSPEIWADEITKALGRNWSKEEIHGSALKFTWGESGEGFEMLYQQLKA